MTIEGARSRPGARREHSVEKAGAHAASSNHSSSTVLLESRKGEASGKQGLGEASGNLPCPTVSTNGLMFHLVVSG